MYRKIIKSQTVFPSSDKRPLEDLFFSPLLCYETKKEDTMDKKRMPDKTWKENFPPFRKNRKTREMEMDVSLIRQRYTWTRNSSVKQRSICSFFNFLLLYLYLETCCRKYCRVSFIWKRALDVDSSRLKLQSLFLRRKRIQFPDELWEQWIMMKEYKTTKHFLTV